MLVINWPISLLDIWGGFRPIWEPWDILMQDTTVSNKVEDRGRRPTKREKDRWWPEHLAWTVHLAWYGQYSCVLVHCTLVHLATCCTLVHLYTCTLVHCTWHGAAAPQSWLSANWSYCPYHTLPIATFSLITVRTQRVRQARSITSVSGTNFWQGAAVAQTIAGLKL